ncbi:unnamed protein product, partial [Pocillopora meandrina]
AYYKNCAQLYNCGQTISGVYTIDPDGEGAFNVYCDQTTDGGGWTVFQRRLDGCMDFNLGWADYKKGFGDFLNGEFWLGLEKIHRLTQNETENRLRVDMGVTKRQTVYAEYLWFGIGDKKDKYRLKLGKKSKCATVNDSLSDHKGSPFGTWDKIYKHCTHKIYGGWWYINNTECAVSSNLNGARPGFEPGRVATGSCCTKFETACMLWSQSLAPIIFRKIHSFISGSIFSENNCAELYNCGQTISGVYTIDPDGKGAFNVYCDQTTEGGGWTVFQRRLDGCMDFNLGWADYKKGFGDFLIGEFWLGLEKIHRLTQNETENRLRVDMGVTKRKTVYAEYLWFGIGDKKDNYRL